jgi:hypothetical protein
MFEIIKNNYYELIGSTSNIFIYGAKIHNINISILSETLQLFIGLGYNVDKFEKTRASIKYTIRK